MRRRVARYKSAIRLSDDHNSNECEQELEHYYLEYGARLIKLIRSKSDENFVQFLLERLSVTERKNLHETLSKKALRIAGKKGDSAHEKLLRQIDEMRESIIIDVDDYSSDLNRCFFSLDLGLYRQFLNLVEELISTKLKNYRSAHSNGISSMPRVLLERIRQIGNAFNLSEKECQILLFLYHTESDDHINNVFLSNSLSLDNLLKGAKHFCLFFDISPSELREIFKKDSPLLGSGLIKKSRGGPQISLSQHVAQYLGGLSTSDLVECFFEKDKLETNLELSDFSFPERNVEVLRDLLLAPISKSGRQILLYGEPGTGKTEYAKSLARSLGMDLYWVRQVDEDGDESLSHRKSALVAAQNLIKGRNAILVVDECDSIINLGDRWSYSFFGNEEKGDEKAWLNNLLEKSQLKVIWISNRVKQIDESTKRRFSYVQEFRAPDKRQRIKAWQIQVSQNRVDFIDQSDIEKLAVEFCVSPGIMALALADISAAKSLASKNEKLEKLRNILNQHVKFGEKEKNVLNPISTNYGLEGINADTNLEHLKRKVIKFYELLEGKNNQGVVNFSLLLLGPPGVGKTEFVKYLAEQTQKELIVKRTSDLLSMWVGGSEKQIAAAFREAEERKAILFLDEADSLFINRENAFRSWEVSQTNELLCQMENFKGILVCATNFVTNLDKAVIRRFTEKVEFKYLSADANLIFFNRILAQLATRELGNSEKARLLQLKNLAPGDFKVVRQRFLLDEKQNPDQLIDALSKEMEMKQLGVSKTINGLAV